MQTDATCSKFLKALNHFFYNLKEQVTKCLYSCGCGIRGCANVQLMTWLQPWIYYRLRLFGSTDEFKHLLNCAKWRENAGECVLSRVAGDLAHQQEGETGETHTSSSKQGRLHRWVQSCLPGGLGEFTEPLLRKTNKRTRNDQRERNKIRFTC